MTSCPFPDEHLSLYVDDLLEAADAAGVRAHLATCSACAALVEDLATITAVARTLGPITPPEHVMAKVIALEAGARFRAPAGDARLPPSSPAAWQALAIAASIIAVLSVGYMVWRGDAPAVPDQEAALVPATGSLEAAAEELELAVRHYERAIRELEAVTSRADVTFDDNVADVMRTSLATLNRAIAESRAAVAEDPTSEVARVSLFSSLQQKVDVLQATALLIEDMDRSDATGFVDVVNTGGRGL